MTSYVWLQQLRQQTAKLDSTKMKSFGGASLGPCGYVRDRLNPWSGKVPHAAGRLSHSTEPMRLEPAPLREKPRQQQARAPQPDHGPAGTRENPPGTEDPAQPSEEDFSKL